MDTTTLCTYSQSPFVCIKSGKVLLDLFVQREINQLEYEFKHNRVTPTDNAILQAVMMAQYTNRHNVERYIKTLHTLPKIFRKENCASNFTKLCNQGFLMRICIETADGKSPFLYAITPAAAILIRRTIKTFTICGHPETLHETKFSQIYGRAALFQFYVSCKLTGGLYDTIQLDPRLRIDTDTLFRLDATIETDDALLGVISVRRDDRSISDLSNRLTYMANYSHRVSPMKAIILCEDDKHMEEIFDQLDLFPISKKIQIFFTNDIAAISFPITNAIYAIEKTESAYRFCETTF